MYISYLDDPYADLTSRIGQHEEDKLRDRLFRRVGSKPRTIHFTLRGGEKVRNNNLTLCIDVER